MRIQLKDPLAGREVEIDVDNILSLRELKLLACRELDINVPTRGHEPGQTTEDVSLEFLERVTLTISGRKLVKDSDVQRLEDWATLVCFVRPRLVHSGLEDEDVDMDEASVETLFKLRRSIPPRIQHFLLKTCRLPEWLVAPWTHISRRQVMIFFGWVVGSKVASNYELGPPYLLGTIFFLIFTNFSTERRREGEWSAYSLFNKNARRIGGDNLRGDVREGWFGF